MMWSEPYVWNNFAEIYYCPLSYRDYIKSTTARGGNTNDEIQR